MKRFLLLLLSLVCLSVFCFCGEAGDDGVVSVNTLDGATDVPVDSSFRYTFSQPVDTSTVISTSYFILPLDEVSADVSKSPFDYGICNHASSIAADIICRSITGCDLTPTLNLIEATRYAICLNTDITYFRGNPFEGFMATFTTVADGPYTVGGSLSGLDDGEQAILQNNDSDDLTCTQNGEFTFPTEVADGGEYAVTVLTQPDTQTCTVSSGTGTVAEADVVDISIVCSADAYSVGGTVDGLSGTVVLQNNSADDLTITEDGDFDFATEVADGGGYTVTVLTQPAGQFCTVNDGTGTISGADVTDVDVACTNAQWAKSTTTAFDRSEFEAVTSDSSGNIYAVGRIYSTSEFDFGIGVTVSGGYNSGYNTVVVKYDSSSDAQWAKSTTTDSGNSMFYEVTSDSSGNAYAAGRIYGTSTYDFGNGVTVSGDHGSNNAVIVKYDSSGDAQWAKSTTTGPGTSMFYGVTSDSSGNVYTVGYIESTAQFNFGNGVTVSGGYNSGYNTVVVKYDSSGDAQWAKSTMIADNGSKFLGVSSDSAGNSYAVGVINGTSEFDFGIGVTVSGGYNSGFDAVIVKYNSSGVAQWATSTTTGPNESQFNGVSFDSDGNSYAVGYIKGSEVFGFGNDATDDVTVSGGFSTFNPVIVKYDSSGNAQWAKSATTAPDESESVYNEVSVDTSGNPYAVGYIKGNGEFNFGNGVTVTGNYAYDYNAVIVKYDSIGNTQVARSATEALNVSEFKGVSVDTSGNAYAVGYIKGNVEFDFGNGVTVTGNYDATNNAVIVKYNNP